MGVTLLGALCAYLWLTSGASSQTTDATCSADFDWTGNYLGQNVCLIAAYVRSSCTSDAAPIHIPALPNPLPYYAQPADPDQCTCSVVLYNLLSACALCQGGELISWSSYIKTCPDSAVTAAGFPVHIPNSTVLPSWAYLNISDTDVFSPTQAKKLVKPLDATHVQAVGSTSSASTSTRAALAASTTISINSLLNSLPKRIQNIIAISVNLGFFGIIGLLWCLCKHPYLVGFGWLGDALTAFVTIHLDVWKEAYDLLKA